MADNNKLWFEMGVRDHVTGDLSKIVELLTKIQGGLDVIVSKYGAATEQARRYASVVNTVSTSEEKLAATQEKNADKLKSKWYELAQVRKRLTESVMTARAGGIDTTSAEKLIGSLWSREMSVSKMMKNGTQIPTNFFGADYKEMIRQAKEMARVLRGEVVSAEREVARAEREAAAAARQHSQVNQGLIDSYNRVAAAASKQSRIMGQLQQQMLSYFSLYGAEHFLKNLIQIGGEFEVQHMALKNILGDAQQANSMFKQMKELAVESPFNFRQLVTYAKQLAAFQVPYEEMFDTTKRLADISAGLGVDMNRLILAYGQVKSAAVLRGQELRQFTEAGIPMVKALADEFTRLNGTATSTADVFKLISQRAVPFEMVKKVLWDMTDEGGRFADMQYTLADTLAGKWSNLQDAWEIMLSDIAKGESASGKFLKGMVTGLTSIIEHINTLTPLLATVFAMLGTGFAGRAINNNFRAYGLIGIEKNIAKAQQLKAIELRRKLINKEITEEQYKQGMALNRNKNTYYMLLAQEGKLKGYQIARLIQQKKINVSKERELELTKANKIQEAAQLRLWRMKYAQASSFSLMMKSMGASINAMMGPLGWTMLAVELIGGTLLAVKGHMDEIAEKNKELRKGFENDSNGLKENLEGLVEPSSDEGYRSGVEGLKEMAKQHLANYDAVMLELSGVKSLKEQYDLLKQKLADEQRVFDMADMISDDDIEKLREHVEKAVEEADKIIKAKRNGGMVDDAAFQRELQSLANSFYTASRGSLGVDPAWDNVVRHVLKDMLEGVGASAKASKGITLKLEELLHFEGADAAAQAVSEKLEEILDKSAPDIARKIKYGQELNEAEKWKLHELTNEAILAVERESGPQFISSVQKVLDNADFIAKVRLMLENKKGVDVNDLQRYISKKVITPSGNRADAERIISLAKSGSKKDFDSEFVKNKKDAKEEWEAEKDLLATMKARGETLDDINKQAEKVQSAQYEYELYKKNEQPLGVKDRSKSGNGGSKKDPALEAAKQRLNELKEVMSEYKKLKATYGDTQAKKMMQELFPNVNVAEVVKNYRTILMQMEKQFAKDRNFTTSIRKIRFEYDESQAKEDAQKALAALDKAISQESAKWDLWRSIFQKTGNAELAQVAFNDVHIFDGFTRGLRMKMKEEFGTAHTENLGDTSDFWKMSENAAEEYFKGLIDKFVAAGDELSVATQKSQKLHNIWKQISTKTTQNWVNLLQQGVAAVEEMMTTEEKIAAIDAQRRQLESQKNQTEDPEARRLITAQQNALLKKRNELAVDAFKESREYVKFYASVLDYTYDEAHRIGNEIKKNLVQRFQEGQISAKRYQQELKQIEEQLKKIGEHKGNFMAFFDGGLNGLFYNIKSQADNDTASAQVDLEYWTKEWQNALKNGDVSAAKAASANKQSAQFSMESAQAVSSGMGEAAQTVAIIDAIVHGINDTVQGIKNAFDEIREMYESFGYDTDSDDWSDADTFLSSFSKASQSATDAWDGLKNGNIGQLISGAIGSWTNWFTGFNKGHDKKLDQQIQLHQREIEAIKDLQDSLEKRLDATLGGVYAFNADGTAFKTLTGVLEDMERTGEKYATTGDKAKSSLLGGFIGSLIGMVAGPIGAIAGGITGNVVGATNPKYKSATYVSIYGDETAAAVRKALDTNSYYDTQYALLLKEKDELEAQLKAEQGKKDADEDKIRDYKKQLEDLGLEAELFARNMAEALYGINMKSWASELGDALFEAWKKGEDGAKAFRDKAKELIADVTKSIVSTKIIERALQPLMDDIENMMNRNSGILDPIETARVVSSRLSSLLGWLPNTVEAAYDAVDEATKRAGLGSIKDIDRTNSGTNAIKSITEDQSNLLLSYVNAMRGDLSIHVERFRQFMESVAPGLSDNFANQLAQLKLIEANTRRSADNSGEILNILNQVTTGIQKLKVKVYAE